jgi:hypothetical protein
MEYQLETLFEEEYEQIWLLARSRLLHLDSRM